ncbi:MAG: DNA cytosine methyltransferase [Puniceicoccales bacterium]
MIKCIDLFCGAGGLSHGLLKEGIEVLAGFDIDEDCRYPYEKNNKAVFNNIDIAEVSGQQLLDIYGDAKIRLLAGCAPCQPFSTYSQRYELDKAGKWSLMYEFNRLIKESDPHLVTMENVSSVVRHEVFDDFVSGLERLGYWVWFGVVNCANYGVPQSRNRLVLLASKFGEIEFIRPSSPKPKTVRQTIGKLPAIDAGGVFEKDKLHISASLSELNLKRIKHSRPGGTWRDWPKELVAACHKQSSGKTFQSVYGRMEWDKPAPTMTTQCYGFGNGRFGHPEQDRAISLREAAMLQSFPKNYKFVNNGGAIKFSALGRMIGNAVPVNLGRAIGKSLNQHLSEYF